MSSNHVDNQIQARIAAVQLRAEANKRQREDRATVRRAGLIARYRAKAKRAGIRLGFCGSCARPLTKGTYLLCSKGCGAKLCRGVKSCHKRHNPQCPNRPHTFTDSPGEAA